MIVRYLIFVVGMSAGSLYASTLNGNHMSVPDNAILKVVSENSVHNGLALSIATLESADTLSQSAQFYRELWAEPDAPGFMESQLGNWLLISHLSDGINTVVQLDTTQQNRTVGYISQAITNATKRVIEDRDFPELQRLSTTKSHDGAVSSTVTIYASQASMNATTQRSLNRLIERGWKLITSNSSVKGRSLVLVRGSQRLEIVVSVSHEHPALVVVNRVTSG